MEININYKKDKEIVLFERVRDFLKKEGLEHKDREDHDYFFNEEREDFALVIYKHTEEDIGEFSRNKIQTLQKELETTIKNATAKNKKEKMQELLDFCKQLQEQVNYEDGIDIQDLAVELKKPEAEIRELLSKLPRRRCSIEDD